MKKNRIRLTESQLHRVIKESVKQVLDEGTNDYRGSIQSIVYALIDSNKFVVEDSDNGFKVTLIIPSVGELTFVQGSVLYVNDKFWEDMSPQKQNEILIDILLDLCER